MTRLYKVLLSDDALSDLDDIHRRIEFDSRQNADAFVARLVDRALALELMPSAYRAVGRSRSTNAVVHVTHEGPYLIYYHVIESPPRVTVTEFRHGHRRQPRRFE